MILEIVINTALSSLIYLKLRNQIMTKEETVLASISSVSDAVEEGRKAIRDVVWPAIEGLSVRLQALVDEVRLSSDVPDSVVAAVTSLVDQSKALSAAAEVANLVPSEIDSAIASAKD
jgi:hypothetical protein